MKLNIVIYTGSHFVRLETNDMINEMKIIMLDYKHRIRNA